MSDSETQQLIKNYMINSKELHESHAFKSLSKKAKITTTYDNLRYYWEDHRKNYKLLQDFMPSTIDVWEILKILDYKAAKGTVRQYLSGHQVRKRLNFTKCQQTNLGGTGNEYLEPALIGDDNGSKNGIVSFASGTCVVILLVVALIIVSIAFLLSLLTRRHGDGYDWDEIDGWSYNMGNRLPKVDVGFVGDYGRDKLGMGNVPELTALYKRINNRFYTESEVYPSTINDLILNMAVQKFFDGEQQDNIISWIDKTYEDLKGEEEM